MENKRLAIAVPVGMLMLTRGIVVNEWLLIVAGGAIVIWTAVRLYLRRQSNPS